MEIETILLGIMIVTQIVICLTLRNSNSNNERLLNLLEKDYEHYPLYAAGEVLVNSEGRKIYILDVFNTQYYFRDLDDLDSRYYENLRTIDTYFCRDSICE